MELVLTAAFVLMIDQACKAGVVRRLAPGASVSFPIVSSIRLRHERNPGGFFVSLPRDLAYAWLWLFIALAVTVVVALTPFFANPISRAALGAVLGGSASNVIDRLRHGAVVDFLDLGFRATFNFADVAILVGLSLALYLGF